MSTNTNVDLVVVGTGSAAGSVAYTCRSAGWTVMVIDSRLFGGRCQLRGCDPKKVLVGGAELVDWNHRMQSNGVPASGLIIDWPDLMRFKRTFTDAVPNENERSFASAGIGTLHGRAHFIDRTTLRVDDHAPAPRSRSSTAAPARWSGSILTSSSAWSRPPAEFGVEVHLKTHVDRVEDADSRVLVYATTGQAARTFEAAMAVHSAGRVPEIVDDLDLEAANVVWEKSGVSVNEYLQSTSNPAVYAAGDAVASGGFPLTPVASMQGAIVASNLLKGNHRTPDYRGIPSVVFTVPPLAGVGLQEVAALDQGLRFTTVRRTRPAGTPRGGSGSAIRASRYWWRRVLSEFLGHTFWVSTPRRSSTCLRSPYVPT